MDDAQDAANARRNLAGMLSEARCCCERQTFRSPAELRFIPANSVAAEQGTGKYRMLYTQDCYGT